VRTIVENATRGVSPISPRATKQAYRAQPGR